MKSVGRGLVVELDDIVGNVGRGFVEDWSWGTEWVLWVAGWYWGCLGEYGGKGGVCRGVGMMRLGLGEACGVFGCVDVEGMIGKLLLRDKTCYGCKERFEELGIV